MNSEPEDSGQAAAPRFSSADCRTAELPDGTEVEFTRAESRILARLLRNPDRLVTRGQLLDAVSDEGTDRNDRTIDFLINRIRRKLGGDARAPRFIATRYGEGYLWLVPASVRTDIPEGSVVVGPVRGGAGLGAARAEGGGFAREIRATLQAHLAPETPVLWAPDLDPAEIAGAAPALAVDLAFLKDGGRVDCVITARSGATGRIVHAARQPIRQGDRAQPDLPAAARALAMAILRKDWAARALEASDHLPIPVAIHDATTQAREAGKSWYRLDETMRPLRAEAAENPELAMLYAAHLHSKYVMVGHQLFLEGRDTCEEDEGEIERLVLGALDFAQSVPKYAILAGKLLYFIDRGFRDMAVEMAETAHRSHTAAAASLATIGQMRGFTGDTDSAIECLRQAVELSPAGSTLRRYVLVMLCQAAKAAGDREELARARQALDRAVPAGQLFFEPIFGDPDAPSLRARAATMMMSRRRARAALMHLHYVSARLYRRQDHRENVIRTPLKLFQNRWGPEVVPEPLARLVPALIG